MNAAHVDELALVELAANRIGHCIDGIFVPAMAGAPANARRVV